MNNPKQYIWYASYGSNLLESRFLCYLLGGRPEGAQLSCRGCLDQSLPLRSETVEIPHQLYFARESLTWSGGGVAFIGKPTNGLRKTYGRMYLITEEQFSEVVAQEMDTDEKIRIDFGDLEAKGSGLVKESAWYGRILCLGRHDGFPIFTFTFDDDFQPLRKPELAYLRIISKGLKETYNFANEEIAAYLASQPGVTDNYTISELLELMS